MAEKYTEMQNLDHIRDGALAFVTNGSPEKIGLYFCKAFAGKNLTIPNLLEDGKLTKVMGMDVTSDIWEPYNGSKAGEAVQLGTNTFTITDIL